MIEQLLNILQIYFKFFQELVLYPLLDIIHHRLPSKDDEITISINITPAGQRQREALASKTGGPVERPPVKSVKFEEVQIRTYESILGDNPSCSRGPPLAIGWDYTATPPQTMHVDTFENHPCRRDRPQYAEFELLIERAERERTLMKLGYTKAEIAAATRQGLKDKKKRRQTADNLSMACVEETVEGIKKSLRRNFMFKKGTKAMYKDWKKVVKRNGIDESQHHLTGRRHSDNDEWYRTQSILVLGRGDSGRSGDSDRMPGLEVSEVEDMSITLESTERCKLSDVRGGHPSYNIKLNRRSSV